ncbi:hypothetical protein EMIT0P291_110020 [Pseudomonas sp. IT-P291]
MSVVATSVVADSVEVVLQPASVATANKVPNDASFQGMKPPYSMIKLRSCDNQTGVWFHRQCLPMIRTSRDSA